MIVIITMAGLGSRFRKAGYDCPKYMIEAKGKTLFDWSMDSLVGYNKKVSKYIFVVRKDDGSDGFIRKHMMKYGISDIEIIGINHMTDGQATTCMLAIPYCNPDEEIMVYNIDTYVEPNEMKYEDISGDGHIPCFHADGDHWSFVRQDEYGNVVEVREKERISDNCTLGAYYFKSAKLYKKLYEEYYADDSRMEKSEKYIAPLYNYMIEQGMKVTISLVAAGKVHVLGTPEELDDFLNYDTNFLLDGKFDMPKVAILTTFQYYNYGTALQVTALSKVIDKLGLASYVINYHFKSTLAATMTDVSWKSWITHTCVVIRNHFKSTNIVNSSKDKFLGFYESNLRFTMRCDLLSELQQLNDEYDAFICGSDQIWNPLGFDSHAFLDFVSDNNKKIAYAPSVGLPKIKDRNTKAEMARLARQIAHLSTREKSGSALIADITGREVKTVLDPTLLLYEDDWDKLIDSDCKLPKTPYLIVYMLGQNESAWKKVYDIADKLHLNVNIIPVFKKDYNRKGCITYPIGPSEFLSLLKNASYVCTDSFHGMAFSVNFNKQFTVFERFKRHDSLNQNSRIYNLADALNLNDRIYRRNSDTKTIYAEIDYKRINDTRRKLVDDSLDYLKSALDAAISFDNEKKNNIRRNHTLCCGCGSCKSVCPADAIEVKMNKDGFFSAFIDNGKCISCGKCITVCPYASNDFSKHITQGAIYSFKSKSPDVLLKSSSGGAAFHISQIMQRKGYSVVACTYDVEKQKARHIVVDPTEKDRLSRLQGSKYMQSEFAPVAEQIYRDREKKYLIIGTPCQIAGVRNSLKDRSNVIYADLICHGVPSYHLFTKYREYLHRRKRINPADFDIVFRDKRFGWREIYIYTHDFKNENIAHQNKDLYFLSFVHGFCYSHSCYECPWRDKSAADLRLGDYWHKKFEKDKTGVSEVIAMTESGRKIIEEMQEEGVADIISQQIEDYTTVQQMTNHREPVFWQKYIDALSNEDVKLEEAHNKYVLPAEKIRRIRYKAYKILKNLKVR